MFEAPKNGLKKVSTSIDYNIEGFTQAHSQSNQQEVALENKKTNVCF